MSFFNKKEEVLDLQLTQFGKQLFSQGKFKPTYYAFFDNNVLYDSSHSGFLNETTVDIEDRIQEETPYCKTQYVFSSRETAMQSFIESNRTRLANQPDAAVLSFANPAEKAYTQILPLGNAEAGTQKAPYFSVGFLNGELSGSVTTAYSSSYSVQKIPQLNATIKFTIKPIDEKDVGVANSNVKYAGFFPQTRTLFKITHDHILLQILENNVEFEKENFEILPYTVETVDNGTVATAINNSYEQLNPLPFEVTQFVNEDGTITEDITKTSDFINHFFEVLVDEEIPKEIICQSVKRMAKLDYLLDDDYDCEDLQPNLLPVNLYQSTITEDDIENCEI